MNKILRRYLQTLGLPPDASERQALEFWKSLGGGQRAQADELAGEGRRDVIERLMNVRADSLRENDRSIEAIFTTEGQVVVYDYRSGRLVEEVLRADGVTLPESVPMLESHYRYTTQAVYGSGRELRVQGGSVIGRLYFAEAATGEDIERAWQLVRQKHLRSVSAGYVVREATMIEPGQSAVVAGRKYNAGDMPLRIVTNWELREISLVVIGADAMATIRLANQEGEDRMNKKLRKYLESLGLRTDATDAQAMAYWSNLAGDQRDSADALATATTEEGSQRGSTETPAGTSQAGTEGTRSEAGGGTSTVTSPETTQRTSGSQNVDATRQAAIAERERVEGIRSLVDDGDVPRELMQRAINEDWSVDRAGREFLVFQRGAQSPPVGAGQTPHFNMNRRHGREDTHTETALAYGLMGRVGARMVDPHATEEARREMERFANMGERFQRMNMYDMCREALRLEGREEPLYGEDMIRAALSTGSLANIFGAPIRVVVLQSFEETSDTTMGWTEERDEPNFQPRDLVALSHLQSLDLHKKGKEANHASINDDDKETYRVRRFKKALYIDETDVQNEDYGVFQDLPRMLGEAAGRLRPDSVYSDLLANASLHDDVALFHEDRANLISAALGQAGIKSAIAIMRGQRAGENNEIPLNIRPYAILVPHDLEDTAWRETNSDRILLAGTAGSVTEKPERNWIRELGLGMRVDSRLGTAGVRDPLDGTLRVGTATNWFLVSNRRTIVVGFLAGTNRRPRVKRITNTGTLEGLGWWVTHDIGTKPVSGQTMVKSSGGG